MLPVACTCVGKMLVAFKLDDMSQKDCSAQEALQSCSAPKGHSHGVGTHPQGLFQEAHADPFLIRYCCPCLPFAFTLLQASVLLCLQPLKKHKKTQETSLLSLPSVGTTSCIWLRAHWPTKWSWSTKGTDVGPVWLHAMFQSAGLPLAFWMVTWKALDLEDSVLGVRISQQSVPGMQSSIEKGWLLQLL